MIIPRIIRAWAVAYPYPIPPKAAYTSVYIR